MIECESLVKLYRSSGTEVFALQGLDLQVRRGEVMAIVGNSGSGKSTLMNVLGGLDAPTAGAVRVDSWDLTRLTERARDTYRRKVCGFVWQNSGLNLLPYLTALDNVQLAMSVAGLRPDPAEARRLLDLVGIGHRKDGLPSRLSGGEQQRAAVAVALAHRPPVLLADEPTGSLDASSAHLVLDGFHRVNEALGTTILLVTHDPAVAAQAGRSIRIRDGKVAAESRRGAGEVLVLDRAGRLQIPRKILEAAGIEQHATVTVRENAILLHPPNEVIEDAFPSAAGRR